MAKVFNIKQFVFDYSIPQSELSDVLGLKQPQVSLLLNGKRKILEKHEEAMRAKYGSLIDPYFVEKKVSKVGGVTILPAAVIDDIKNEWSQPKAEEAEVVETLEAVPILSPDQVKSPNFDVKLHVDNGSDQIQRLPIAQILAKFGEFEVVSPTYRDSMIPAYMPGDFLFVQYKRDWNSEIMLKQGIYLIDTTIHGSILCMIEDMEDGRLRLTFKNSKKYKPMVIPKDIVLSVATVSFFIRMGDMAFDVEDTAYLQHLLDCQIDQYNQLMVQYGKTGDRVDRIISQNEHLISNHERIIDVLISEKKK